MNKEHLYEFVKSYLEGTQAVKVESDYARGMQQGFKSLKELLEKLEAKTSG